MRLDDWFQASVLRFPDRVAVMCGEQQWTYAQLDAVAEEVAAGLRAHGVQPEEPIGLCMQRSCELIAAILGAYKAGTAYVALDPHSPPHRLRYMAEDSGLRLLITDDIAPPVLAGYRSIAFDRCRQPRSVVSVTPGIEGLAYILYTADSNGDLTGALVSHAHVNALLRHSWQLFEFDENGVWSQLHSCAVDFSVWEIWGALAYGGRLVIIDREVAAAPAALCQQLQAQRITILNQTPRAFRALVSHVIAHDVELPGLNMIILGGEALDSASVLRWFDTFGSQQPLLVNMYGRAETTVHVTFCPLTAADVEHGDTAPLGQRLPHLRVYVLDSQLQPVATGSVGEIYVAGESVAWGYLGRPAQTAERFLPDPFSARSGMRLYRSGDLGLFDLDGNLQYVGRADAQVERRA